MNEAVDLLRLHDLDLIEAELTDARARARMKRLGLSMERLAPLTRARAACLETAERRWLYHYERSNQRYGRGLVAVRDRVCQGCHITLPTSRMPNAAGALTLCEFCCRVLYWA